MLYSIIYNYLLIRVIHRIYDNFYIFTYLKIDQYLELMLICCNKYVLLNTHIYMQEYFSCKQIFPVLSEQIKKYGKIKLFPDRLQREKID